MNCSKIIKQTCTNNAFGNGMVGTTTQIKGVFNGIEIDKTNSSTEMCKKTCTQLHENEASCDA